MKSFDCKACKVSADRSIFLTKLFKKLSRGGEERSAEAAVYSRRMATARFPTPGNTWDYLVTFILSDGTQLELHTREDEYQNLTAGSNGNLIWEGETFLHFEPQTD